MRKPKKDQAQAEAADRIREFKQLLDEGAITQEEFDQQKAKILGEQDDLKF
ncbi:SHOCT domain-containing protein [Lacticaseibacillus camelliae]|uniref:SHOCT domain-containing protein n=1 Tax=Lacticaseibacillus camelliae TaxID=381742 RepID=UPI0009EA5128|nr:SHOCT domain-containing protein [Lacticaseibacillus camelliae]